jgi:hypothetical protein
MICPCARVFARRLSPQGCRNRCGGRRVAPGPTQSSSAVSSRLPSTTLPRSYPAVPAAAHSGWWFLHSFTVENFRPQSGQPNSSVVGFTVGMALFRGSAALLVLILLPCVRSFQVALPLMRLNRLINDFPLSFGEIRLFALAGIFRFRWLHTDTAASQLPLCVGPRGPVSFRRNGTFPWVEPSNGPCTR